MYFINQFLAIHSPMTKLILEVLLSGLWIDGECYNTPPTTTDLCLLLIMPFYSPNELGFFFLEYAW